MPTLAPTTAPPPLVAGPFRMREVAYAPGLRQPRHLHATMGLTLVLRGALREQACGREEIASALSVVVKPAGVEHADEIGPQGARTFQILFDPSEARPLVGDDRVLEHWSWMHGRRAAAVMLALLRQVRRAHASSAHAQAPTGTTFAPALEDLVIDALATTNELRPLAGTAPRWIERVREAIDDTRDQPASVASLAREVGAHAVSVSRAFRRHFGCTISEYRRRQRLRRAAALIEGSAHRLSFVAHASGHADHAHLCREFRALAGVTPREFRTLARPEHGTG